MQTHLKIFEITVYQNKVRLFSTSSRISYFSEESARKAKAQDLALIIAARFPESEGFKVMLTSCVYNGPEHRYEKPVVIEY